MPMPRPLVALAACVLGLAACEQEATAPTTSNDGVTIDASSTSAFTYFSLATGQVVSVPDPRASTAWDLAFRQWDIRLNGGISGPGAVSGYDLGNNASASSAQVLAFTPANQLPAFDSVDASRIPPDSAFAAESLAANPFGWLAFGAAGPEADPSQAWKVRRAAGGGFAVFRTTALVFAGSTPQTATLDSVTVQWRYQPDSGSLGAVQTVVIPAGSDTNALDFATGALSPPSGCGWDLEANADFTLTVNGGACAVGTYPLDASENFDSLTSASGAPAYGAFLAGLSGPIPYSTSLDDPSGAFLYDLAGDHRLSPTFNIYLIKVGTSVYKLQVTGYYNATGTSGYPTIRFAKIR